MQDPQNNLSTSSFRQQIFPVIKYALAFFIPVVVGYIIMEFFVLKLPANYKNNSAYYYKNKDTIEVMVLGSSQMAGAVNPEFIDKQTISLASASQHHKLDFAIIKQLKPTIKNLRYVVLELSPNHLELPHNSKNFWKNSVYLKYYNVNAFERKTYFKDELIFLSNPDLYSKKLIDHYILNEDNLQLNKFGFDLNNNKGVFNKLKYNKIAIANLNILPNQKEDTKIFKHNSAFLFSMLDYLEHNNISVIICTLPLYPTYSKRLNPNIVKRRDSIISLINDKYTNVIFLETENDTTVFNVTNFYNPNHLNPKGAEIFTKKLNEIINKTD